MNQLALLLNGLRQRWQIGLGGKLFHADPAENAVTNTTLGGKYSWHSCAFLAFSHDLTLLHRSLLPSSGQFCERLDFSAAHIQFLALLALAHHSLAIFTQ